MKNQLVRILQSWLPEKVDIPEGLRIGIPMIVSLISFSLFNNNACGINGLICAWLVGVQGRNLAYPKRAELLSKSAVICCISSALALLSFIHSALAIFILSIIGLIYGLTSNQRKYIQLLAYNSGFCFICSLHFLHQGADWKSVLLSSFIGSFAAVISAVIAGPWLAIQQGQSLLKNCTAQLGNWSNILSHSDLHNVNQRLSMREELDEAIAILSHWLLEMPNKPEVINIAHKLQSILTLIDLMETICKIKQQTQKNALPLKHYLQQISLYLKQHELGNASATIENRIMLSPPKLNALCPCKDLLNGVHQQIIDAIQLTDKLASNWRQQLKMIWPSDHESIRHHWSIATQPHSREWHHGLRILFTLLSCQIVVNLLKLPQGYWVTLTAYILLMVAPLGVLQHRIWKRFYGTVAGSIIALAMIYFLGQGFWLYPATCITVFLAFATYYKSRYEIHVFWLTMMIVFAVSLLLPSEPYIAFYRTLDTLTGVIISFLSMHIFLPSWTRRWLDSYIANWWNLELKWLMSLQAGQYNTQHRWQAHAALRQLNQEIHFMCLEPNISPKELSDWKSLLWYGLTVHSSLIIMEKQQARIYNSDIFAFKNWLDLYQHRLKLEWSVLNKIGHSKVSESNAKIWLQKDLNILFAWLNSQRPFEFQSYL